MKKLIGITSLLLSMTLVSCGNQGGNNVDPVDPKTPYHTEVWDNTIKMMLDKFTDEYWDVLSMKKHVTNEEWKQIKAKQEPFLSSM